MKLSRISLYVKLLDAKIYMSETLRMKNTRPTDPIETIKKQWRHERPELDPSGFGIVGRILVLAEHLRRRVSATLAPLDLGLWAFDVLATLRRQGAPYRLTPKTLSQATMLTTGAMTNRLDRLEEAGLIRREKNPQDRRGLYVLLTKRGLTLVDQAIALRLEEANEAVANLSATERRSLERLLASLLTDIEEKPRVGG